MRPLFLDATRPLCVNVQDGALAIAQGKEKIAELSLQSPKWDYDTLVLHGHAGYVSLAAINWLNQFGIAAHFIGYDGTLYGSLIPNSGGKRGADAEKQVWQLRASENPKVRLDTARKILALKLQLSGFTNVPLHLARTIEDLQHIELGYANRRFTDLFGKEFRRKSDGYHTQGARDKTNCCLNFAYCLAEAQARRLIVGNGLSTRFGFMHRQNEAFVYDMEEPYRWACELAVRDILQEGFERDDFIRLADYRLRFSSYSTLKQRIVQKVAQHEQAWSVRSGERTVGFDEFAQRQLDALTRMWQAAA